MRMILSELRNFIREELSYLFEGRHQLQRVDWEEYIPPESDPRVQEEIKALKKRNPKGYVSPNEVLDIRINLAPSHIKKLYLHKNSYKQRAIQNWEQSGNVADVYPVVLNNPGFRYEEEQYFYPKKDEHGNWTRGKGIRNQAYKTNPDFVMAMTPDGDWDWHLQGVTSPSSMPTHSVELDAAGNVPRTAGMKPIQSAADRRALNTAISADQQGRNVVRRRRDDEGNVVSNTSISNVTPHIDRFGNITGYTISSPTGRKYYTKDEYDAVERRRRT